MILTGPPKKKTGNGFAKSNRSWEAMNPRLNVLWNEARCKRCMICVEVCPVRVLFLDRNKIHEKDEEKDGCIRCFQCERYCPDIAIEVMDGKEAG